jgi:DNA-binding response OmpR family regulator
MMNRTILLVEDNTIVALTAHALPADVARGRELGFAAYLTKPIEPRRVVAEIERITLGTRRAFGSMSDRSEAALGDRP